jgi:hypothetical protein
MACGCFFGGWRPVRLTAAAVLVVAAAVAIVSARPYAGGWNDGSRLATVEALVDQHTLAIDHSIFVDVPASASPDAPRPYPPHDELLLRHGTSDKLFIGGHYYSDKSPVPALLMAGVYRCWQACTGLTAREHPGRFCYGMTLVTSGLAYVIAVWCVFCLTRTIGLSEPLRLGLTASFGLATVAVAYVHHVNNHILLLTTTAALLLGLVRLPTALRDGRPAKALFCGLGALSGLAYSIDLGAGPVLFAGALALVVYRSHRVAPVSLFLLAAMPWLVLHHALNYAVGGTFKPANAVPEYFQWPGCSFRPQDLTGAWNHPTVVHFLLYAADLLVGKRGFLGHNLALYLAIPAAALLCWKRIVEWPELLLACAWAGGTWLAYAVTSVNSSGLCCSIRWFVPLLAPGYYVLGLSLREHPRLRPVFALLSGWGAVLGALMWWKGPWTQRMIPLYWPIEAAALLSVAGYTLRLVRRGTATAEQASVDGNRPKAAA